MHLRNDEKVTNTALGFKRTTWCGVHYQTGYSSYEVTTILLLIKNILIIVILSLLIWMLSREALCSPHLFQAASRMLFLTPITIILQPLSPH